MASTVDANQTLRNCTNSQSIVYLTDLTNIYQEQDCLTTKIPPPPSPPPRKEEYQCGSAHFHIPLQV